MKTPSLRSTLLTITWINAVILFWYLAEKYSDPDIAFQYGGTTFVCHKQLEYGR